MKRNNNGSGKQIRPPFVLILLNILLMIVVACALGWLAMTFLGVWTNHGKTAQVPDLKGLSYNEAVAKLEAEGMVAELSDSVYETKAKPGQVIEQNPRGGSTVKPGRTVYLTVNAFSPRMIALPKLVDLSLRQARSTLEGLGIKNIQIKHVVSEYPDLVLAVDVNGHPVTVGTRVPVNATIILSVGDGLFEDPDSKSNDGEETELTF